MNSSASYILSTLQELDTLLEEKLNDLSDESRSRSGDFVCRVEELREVFRTVIESYTCYSDSQDDEPQYDSSPKEFALDFSFEMNCLDHAGGTSVKFAPRGLRRPRSDLKTSKTSEPA